MPPLSTFSEGLYDRITLSVNCNTSNVQGNINSPVFGPARQWQSVNWSGFTNEPGNDKAIVNVIGVRKGQADTVLYSLDSTQHSFQYFFRRCQPVSAGKTANEQRTDSATATPYQLTNWNLGYAPVPEGAVAPNLYYSIPDSFNTTAPLSGQVPGIMHIGFAFKNVSKADFDSLVIKIILYDNSGGYISYQLNKLRALAAGDSLHVDEDIDVSTLSGWYNVYVIVNPDQAQPEQYSFNNFLYKYVFITSSITLPVTLLNFNAELEGSKVNTNWKVSNEINTRQYDVEHSNNGGRFLKIGSVSASQKSSYSFIHNNPVNGKNHYRLKIVDKDGKFVYSPVRVVELNSNSLVKVYPNPVRDLLFITSGSTGGKATHVKIMNTYGQQILQQNMSGTITIKTSAWAAGMYLVQVENGQSVTTFNIQKQ